jgi:type II secretory pathway component PulM
MINANYRHLTPWALLLCLALASYPLWQQQAHLKIQLNVSQHEAEQIAQLSQRYLAIVGPSNALQQRFKQLGNAGRWLVTSAQQQGLKVSLQANNNANQTKRIQLAFAEAHFNQLIQWVQTTETSSNLVVTQSLLTAHKNAGKVAGTITFEMN